jgi:threonine dehydratase
MMGSTALGDRANVRLHLKMELFQKTGSFKPRGVLNKLHWLTPEERARGVITLSAGNHAQALAWGAAQSGISALVVMPATAVPGKVRATRDYGAEVILTEGNLLDTTLELQKERGLTLVHPFDDPRIIAGAGTVGLEIIEDLPDVDVVIAGLGGGGLISGVATAIKALKPEVRIIGVEPEGAAAMSASLKQGMPVHLEKVDTVADGLGAPFAGTHTLAHVSARVDEVVIVSDAEILEAMRLLFERVKVTAEPAGSAAVAALLTGRVALPKGTATVCIVSGGNVDLTRLKGWF